MSNHHISAADNLLRGGAFFAPHAKRYDGRRGYLLGSPSYRSLGAALAIVTTALINSATSTDLPNAATKTYTGATNGTAPLDSGSRPTLATVVMADGSSQSVWPLDVPRNLVMTVTHGSSIVALSCVVTGYDEYGLLITESLAVTATGTSKTATGKKAFKYIKSYAFTSAGNATTDTALIGWGNTLGLPYRVTDVNAVLVMANGVPDASATVTAADDTAPTASTGDPRGTVLSATAADGTKKFAHWFIPADASTPALLFGTGAS